MIAAAMALAMLPVCASLATEDDTDVSLASATPSPYVYIVSPSGHESYDGADRLTVRAGGGHVSLITLELRIGDQTYTYQEAGDSVEHVFTFDTPQTQGATLIVRGYADVEPAPGAPYAQQTITVLSPKAELIEKMIALAYANSTDSRYRFAPAQKSTDIGICKNFVMRLFDTYSGGYRMLAYP
ncbi:MAG: hypothetical protein LLF96_11435, partial [Eubacteriales bacterium]|nr:hypothetical protein [Eubacteriales bacterium]